MNCRAARESWIQSFFRPRRTGKVCRFAGTEVFFAGTVAAFGGTLGRFRFTVERPSRTACDLRGTRSHRRLTEFRSSPTLHVLGWTPADSTRRWLDAGLQGGIARLCVGEARMNHAVMRRRRIALCRGVVDAGRRASGAGLHRSDARICRSISGLIKCGVFPDDPMTAGAVISRVERG